MRSVWGAILLAFAVLALGILLALVVDSAQPQYPKQLKNGYYPYSVETVVRDK